MKVVRLLVVLVLVVLAVTATVGAARRKRFRSVMPRAMRAISRVGKGSHSRERFLAIPQVPYPYYQRPKYRYPFYDQHGNGHLLYGYGDKRLYSYTKFKPLEGYSKRR
ncbi:uncharacterized protein LOC119099237 [Pollicipes pollicipes]|uniref:uncharacterized protein LOC119099069 n=1 Tax=Pollicipes pollicipes TaxID=41117 RepID=UPI0018855B45|nr:uncharacterized protein LOC119099069 [Pollicipes pollicipes]XP_037078252.1 uncharacterized protein LOC119099237 [Pollicipes pollicipes]